VPHRGVEHRVEHVVKHIERHTVGDEDGVGTGRIVVEAVPLQCAAVEGGLREPCVSVVPRAVARVRTRA